jgi:predicted XRE-type DNA-binding protein
MPQGLVLVWPESACRLYKFLYSLDMADTKPIELRGNSLCYLRAFPRFAQGVRAMSQQRFASVWDAIEDTPEAAGNMKLRSMLMMALKQHINHTEMSQAQAAQRLGVTQPCVSDLMRGKIDLFGLDALVNMASAVGLYVEMRILEAV